MEGYKGYKEYNLWIILGLILLLRSRGYTQSNTARSLNKVLSPVFSEEWCELKILYFIYYMLWYEKQHFLESHAMQSLHGKVQVSDLPVKKYSFNIMAKKFYCLEYVSDKKTHFLINAFASKCTL